MNSKKNKKFKCSDNSKNSKAESNNSEILVLPPNLLQQLGIHLGNIRNSQECSVIKDNEVFNTTYSNTAQEKETSITETAKLMKKSVLLSPSFLPTNLDVHQENKSIENTVQEYKSTNCVVKNSDTYKSDDITDLNKIKRNFPHWDETQYDNTIQNDKSISSISIKRNSEVLESGKLPHETSDLSSIPKNTESKNKINIISQEIIDVEKFNKLKLDKSKFSLISSTIHAPITKSQINNFSQCGKISSFNSFDNSSDSINIKTKIDKDTEIKEMSKEDTKLKPEGKKNNTDIPNGKPELCTKRLHHHDDIYLNNKVKNTETLRTNGFDCVSVNVDLEKCNNLLTCNVNNLITADLENTNILNIDKNKDNTNKLHNSHSSLSSTVFLTSENEIINNEIELVKNTELEIKKSLEKDDVKSFCCPDDLMVTELKTIDNSSKTELAISESSSYTEKRPTATEFVKIEEGNPKVGENIQVEVKKVILNDKCGKYIEKNNNFSERRMSEKDPKNSSLESHKVSIQDHHGSQIAVDKVKEIASYLSQCLLPDKKKIGSKRYLKSKLCIQGVEKPGGFSKKFDYKLISRPIKTYNNPKSKIVKSQKYTTYSGEIKNKIYEENISIEDHESDPFLYCSKEEFCNCKDFGRLQFYGYEKDYQHIHFWEQKSQSFPMTIFEIYNDDSCSTYKEELNDGFITDYVKRDFHEYDTFGRICCHLTEDNYPVSETSENNITLLKNHTLKTYESDTIFPNSCEHTKIEDIYKDSTNYLTDQISKSNTNVNDVTFENSLYEKKRRRSVQTSQINTEEIYDTVSQCKKYISSIKCGVCSKEFSEVDWENHISEEHCYIAWRDGLSLDFGNENLLKKICQRLKEVQSLKCTFCGIEKQCPKMFVIHAQNCMKNFFHNLNIKHDVDKMKNNKLDTLPLSSIEDKFHQCGVCAQEVLTTLWVDHIATEHNYQAWKLGENPLDFQDKNVLFNHLEEYSKQSTGLICCKCGITLKNVTSYLQHVESCGRFIENETPDDDKNTFLKKLQLKDEPIKCGVCHLDVDVLHWMDHIGQEHNYLAWKDGDTALDVNDEEETRKHLHNITKEINGLVCAKCGMVRKYAKSYMQHIKSCDGSKAFNNDTMLSDPSCEITKSDVNNETLHEPNTDDSEILYTGLVKCGVCQKEVKGEQWIDHIQKEHNYLARIEGKPPLDLNDEEEVRNHLHHIRTYLRALVCAKCGLKRKHIKAYLQHVKNCDGILEKTPVDISHSNEKLVLESTLDTSFDEFILKHTGTVICAVCEKQVDGGQWVDHIQKEHDYLAWVQGNAPLDVDDEEQVRQYLNSVSKHVDGLVCAKCGLVRKYVKAYLQHIKKCDGTVANVNDSIICEDFINEGENEFIHTGMVECGVCDQEVDGEQWIQHIQKDHGYLARVKGKQPLDVDNEEQVRQYLNCVSKHVDGLVCAKCGLVRKYVKAYLQHVKKCDGTVAVNDSVICEDFFNEGENEFIHAGMVECGVCDQEVDGGQWIQHIQKDHGYLARVKGKQPLDVDNEEQVRQYLNCVSKHVDGLVCAKCGLVRKYVKAYLQHIKKCDGTVANVNESVICEDSFNEGENEFIHTGMVECGVCDQEVDGGQWIQHIQKNHGYLARVKGKQPLDINDDDEIQKHLSILRKCVEELICAKCGLTRKNVKWYMKHVKNCNGSVANVNDSIICEDFFNEGENEFIHTGMVECGVCDQEVDGGQWIQHIQKDHGYLARVKGKQPLDMGNEEQVRQYLNCVSKHVDGLVCAKCGLVRKYVKAYLQHIKKCDGTVQVDEVLNDTQNSEITSDFIFDENNVIATSIVKCGVCQKEIEGKQWLNHIKTEHNYLAWIEGKTPLDLKNKKQVKNHLLSIIKQIGCLTCAKCGIKRKHLKSYLHHIRKCDDSAGLSIDSEDQFNDSCASDNADNTVDEQNIFDSEFIQKGTVKCGVCQKEVDGEQWLDHIQREHNYLARVEGKPPLNMDNSEEVHAFLYTLSKKINGLICKTCGLKRKYVKSFLQHIDTCTEHTNIGILNEDNLLECAVCSEKVPPQDWKSHAMKNHYNIAWAVGMEPIDLRNSYAVEKYLKDYKQVYKNLICKICKTSRASSAGFYAHIITCGKTEEETEYFKSYCDICNCKYLCIYKSQHLKMHRDQELAKERKLQAAEEKTKRPMDGEDYENTQGRRKAAQKAKNVIENYKANASQYSHTCTTCGFGTDIEKELEEHSCETYSEPYHNSDSDCSVQYDAHSDDESEDSDIDSNISREEEEVQQGNDNKKKRCYDPPIKVQRLPFKVNSASRYVTEAALDVFNTHFTHEVLFPEWKVSEYNEVPSEDLPKYLPPLEQSCQVNVANEGWTIYKRFEARKGKVCSVFVGASIRCVAWAPVRAEGAGAAGAADERGDYLALGCHRGPDAPRLNAAHVAHHAGMLQIWNFADFTRLPKFVLGVVHDYGTVWAMDWCPSGARDLSPSIDGQAKNSARLGLLAIACSNGSAYILVVPYPTNENTEEAQIIRIKPVAELRLCSSKDRKKYQATAISWSQQKGHTVILVAYADGTTAFYDLACDSPLLRTIEDGVTILYPYQDERPHNTCVLDVGVFPSGSASRGAAWGAVCSASSTGVRAALHAPASLLHAPLATAHATFTPHWPSVLISTDEAISHHTLNELEWLGGGRRLGAARALATCARCGLAAAYAPPALRALRTHPAYADPRRDIVGMLRMAPLAKKRSKHVNDELSMKVEPLTYEDAVKHYGIEFKLKNEITKCDQKVIFEESKQHNPERFPLADVAALAFCPARHRHAALALATHAGLLLLLHVT
ncbi:unnamed protein product [Parnassius mnemosyne]|uniref:C2H2-type domain-containing protein n=1 Tax=Parnassius mnemosyne TaxID=213953 RepID=A0AAV1M8G0_9NEOP